MRFPDDVPVLSDGAVTLRAHVRADVPAVHEQCQDPLSRQWTTVPVPYSTTDAEHFVGGLVPAGWVDDSEWAFAVEAPDDDGTRRFAGTVSLRNEGGRRAEIAYGSHPWARGRGVFRRALELLLGWGFEQQGLETVIWWANRGNHASRRIAWRLGFSMDGELRHWLPQRGALRDAWVGVLLATDRRVPRHPWIDVPRIAGKRVGLRAHQPRDAVRLQQAADDATSQHWLQHFASPFELTHANAYLDQRAELAMTGRGLGWTVADPATDELLAAVTLFGLRAGHDAEIGYVTHPDARGRGLTTEAVALAVRHAFVPTEAGGLGLARLRLQTTEANTASRRVAEGAGFVLVGRERDGTRLRDGGFVDAVCYDLLAREYGGPAASVTAAVEHG